MCACTYILKKKRRDRRRENGVNTIGGWGGRKEEWPWPGAKAFDTNRLDIMEINRKRGVMRLDKEATTIKKEGPTDRPNRSSTPSGGKDISEEPGKVGGK